MRWIKASDRLPSGGEVHAKFGRLIGTLTKTAGQVIWQDKEGQRVFDPADNQLLSIEWLDETPELHVAPSVSKVCVRNCSYCVSMAQDGFCEHVREASKAISHAG